MKKSLILLVVVGLLTVPSFGQLYQEDTGWFVDIGTWYVQPDNSFQIAQKGDYKTNSESYDGISFDFDEGIAPQIEFGYKTGKIGDFSLSYRTYDEDADEINKNTGLYELLFVADIYGYVEYGDHLLYRGNTESWQTEFKWSNSFGSGNSWTGKYFLGLRAYDYSQKTYLRMEDTLIVAADWSYLTESEGLGLSGGIRGSYEFTDSVSLYGNLNIALLRADNSYKSNYKFVYDTVNRTNYSNGFPAGYNIKEQVEYSDEIVTQYDLNLGVKYNIVAGLYTDTGYKFSSWENMGANIYGFENEDIGWNGFYLNIGYNFGGTTTGGTAPGW